MFPGKVMISEHSPGMSFPGNIPLNWMTQLLEVKISLIARLSIRRSVDWLVGRSVCLSVIISLKSGKFHFHAPIGALVFVLILLGIIEIMLKFVKISALFPTSPPPQPPPWDRVQPLPSPPQQSEFCLEKL